MLHTVVEFKQLVIGSLSANELVGLGLVNGLTLGIVSLIAMFAFAAAHYSKRRELHYYGLYLSTTGLIMAQIFAAQSDFVPLHWHLLVLMSCMLYIFKFLFVERFLNLQQFSSILSQAVRLGPALLTLSMFCIGLFWNSPPIMLWWAPVLVCNIALVGLSVYCLRQGLGGSAYLLAAWSLQAICFALLIAKLESWLPWQPILGFFSVHWLAVLVEVLTVGGVLVYRYVSENQKRLHAEHTALKQERELRLQHEEALQEQLEANEELEGQMRERTFELEVSLREIQEINEQLEHQSEIDFLTGVHNRKFFDKQLQSHFRRSRREQTPLSAVMLDIDHFKKVNDQYGHLAGDDCLRLVAQQVQHCLHREGDVLCRFGGEEFGILLYNTELQGAEAVAERIVQSVAETPVATRAGTIDVTLSAGVSCLLIDRDTPMESFLQMADEALYQSKQYGRNQVRCHIHSHRQAESADPNSAQT